MTWMIMTKIKVAYELASDYVQFTNNSEDSFGIV